MNALSLTRVVAVLLVIALAGCDSSVDQPAVGEFNAEIRGNAQADFGGTARFVTFERPDWPEEGYFKRAEISLTGASGQEVGVAIYEVPRERTYRVPESAPTEPFAYVGARVDGDNYTTNAGTVRLTLVTDTVIEGEFDAEGRCCGNSFAGIPYREARLRGRFSATRK